MLAIASERRNLINIIHHGAGVSGAAKRNLFNSSCPDEG
jgi:hypothetical protein